MKSIITIIIICGLANLTFSQNFGIDEANPAEKLDVNGNIRVGGSNAINSTSDHLSLMYGVRSSDNSGYEWIGFYSGTSREGIILYDGAWSGANSLTNEFSITAENNNHLSLNTGSGEHIFLMPKGTGKVGIGTTSPAELLDVNGYIALEGKHAFRGNDSWLRLNQNSSFSSGTYTPGLFRSDGGYQVDGTTVIDANGYVLLSRVTVNAGGGYMHLGQWAGTWNINNGVLVQGSYYWWGASPSDRKLKTNIAPLKNTDLHKLSDNLINTPLYRYQYIEDPSGKEQHIGMMADEAPDEMQMPGKESINIIDGFMMSVAAIKLLKQENVELKERLDQIEKQIGK